MLTSYRYDRLYGAGLVALFLSAGTVPVFAEIDGHGPDAWRVTGVAATDTLNARMGPGTNFPVIVSFAHNERKLEQITCVPFHNLGQYQALTAAQIKALPPRWCLMRDASLAKAGWVAQRFITPDDTVEMDDTVDMTEARPADEPGDELAVTGVDQIKQAELLVGKLYNAYDLAQSSGKNDPLQPPLASSYFTADIVRFLTSGELQAHPLYGAQDFDGKVQKPQRDHDQPMLRGMITVNVDFTNFGQSQRAIYRLRADTSKPDAPLRIFMVEHEEWSYP